MAELPWQAQADVIHLIRDFPASLRPIFEAEIHLFTYLSCLIFVFDENPSSDWGYGFVVTPDGFPYASAVSDTINHFVQRGILLREGSGRVSEGEESFAEELDLHGTLSQSRDRTDWTKTAAQCALMVPRGLIQQAVGRSPGLKHSAEVES